MSKKIENVLENFIFFSRWFQVPIYIGLIIGGLVYTYQFIKELYHLIHGINTMAETDVMLGVLTLVDISMVANLLVVVVIGGYTTFVSKIDVSEHEDKPDWLEKVDAGTLKIKLAVSLVGVSGIHLLKAFVNIDHFIDEMSFTKVTYQIFIHGVFLLSAIALAWADKIQHDRH